MASSTELSYAHALSKFEKLTDHLKATAHLWQPRPFVDIPVPWESCYPNISGALRSLTEPQIDAIRSDLSKIIDVSPELRSLYLDNSSLNRWPRLSTRSAPPLSKHNPLRVSGRKWDQVLSFVSAVVNREEGRVTHWIDWCAGKGILGQQLTKVTGIPSTAIDHNPALAGPTTVIADVLSRDLTELLNTGAGAVALHACGNLNAKLLEVAVQSDCAFLAIAPCCYQRITGTRYPTLSKVAKGSGLRLTNHHLRLVSFDEVVVGRGQRQRRAREHAYRLGFDLLQREATGCDQYRPLGHLPGRHWRGSFRQFAEEMARREAIALPQRWDPDAFEAAGQERWRLNRALSLVRALFSRTLESWLLLDRIHFLLEHHWTVQAGEFCDRRLTPRNLLLAAKAL